MQSDWLGESGSGQRVVLFHQSHRTFLNSLFRFTACYKPQFSGDALFANQLRV